MLSPVPLSHIQKPPDPIALSTKQRYYYMDAMRSILMCLVVFFHAGNIYMVDGKWIVNDPSQSIVFNIVNALMPTFRMTSFFMISGFFCYFSLLKYGPLEFLKLRLVRIFVPLLCTSLLINSIQFWFISRYVDGNDIALVSFILTKLKYVWINNTWASHLWFLINLTVYFIVCTLAFMVCGHLAAKHKFHSAFIGFILKNIKYRYCLIAILPTVSLLFFAIGSVWPPFLYGRLFYVADMYPLLRFLPFFLFGIWLFGDSTIQREFLKGHILEIPLFAICLWISQKTSMDGTTIEKVVFTYFSVLASWLSSSWCFIFFKRFFNHKSGFFKYLSDASYSIYLFHHLIVIATGYYLLRFDFSPVLKWLIVILVTGTLTSGIHHFVVLRFNVIRLMFNGKLNR